MEANATANAAALATSLETGARKVAELMVTALTEAVALAPTVTLAVIAM